MQRTGHHITHRSIQIGELAALFDINPKTIRYYEEIGLLPKPSRSPAGYRQYGPADRERLDFILKAKATGLTLEEIGQVATLRQNGNVPCTHVRTLIDQKLAAIDEQILALMALRQELATLRDVTQDVSSDLMGDARFCWIIEQHDSHRGPNATPSRFG